MECTASNTRSERIALFPFPIMKLAATSVTSTGLGPGPAPSVNPAKLKLLGYLRRRYMMPSSAAKLLFFIAIVFYSPLRLAGLLTAKMRRQFPRMKWLKTTLYTLCRAGSSVIFGQGNSSSRPERPVQSPILDGFGNMFRFNHLHGFQVGNRARYLQDPVVRPRG